MISNPLISVIVPAYNEEKYLSACLSALMKQKNAPPFEIIVVDNNSTDKTRIIAKQFSTKVLIQKIAGRAYARQMGADYASSNILAFTEADCIPHRNWLYKIHKFYITHPHHVGITGIFFYQNTSKIFKTLAPSFIYFTNTLTRVFRKNNTFRGTNFSVKKNILKQAGGFDQTKVPFDDVECGYRVGKLGKIAFIPTMIVETSDRRIKGRVFTYFGEFLHSIIRIFVLNHRGDDNWYKPIR